MSEEQSSLRLLTLTRLWQFAKYVHRVGDISLWVPISHRLLGWTAAVFAPVWLVLWGLGVPWANVGLTLRFALPGLLVWWVVSRIEEGARPSDTVRAITRYLLRSAKPTRRALAGRSRVRAVA